MSEPSPPFAHVQACLKTHLDALFGDRYREAIAYCVQGEAHQKALLRALEPLRACRSNGLSKRPSKREAVLEKLVDSLRRAFEMEEQQWWEGLETRPIAEIVGRLDAIPSEHERAVYERLVNLPLRDPHINDRAVLAYIHCHAKSARRGGVPRTPAVAACIAHLVVSGNDEDTLKMLDRLSTSRRGAPAKSVAEVLKYLKFVAGLPDLTEHLRGRACFDTLSEEDVYLAARYYDEKVIAKPAVESPGKHRKHRAERKLEAIERALREAGVRDERGNLYVNDFRVRGLQPRLAELAFKTVFARLYGMDAADGLVDSNLQCANSRDTRGLPPYDWQDGDGHQYDVKCNLLWREQQQHLQGLRGFLVKKRGADTPRADTSFVGFIFYDRDYRGNTPAWCDWVYIGEYTSVQNFGSDDRVLPFLFRLPDCARYTVEIDADDVEEGLSLLEDQKLRFGWQLAAGVMHTPDSDGSPADDLMHSFLSGAIAESAKSFLEFGLWKALTVVTFEACANHGRDTVLEFLKAAGELTNSRALPVCLPRFRDDATLLDRWIRDVLTPLANHWDSIACPGACESKAIRVEITRMTSEGTILGKITCTSCHGSREEATLLTHCHGCGHYPLIIGKNGVCPHCDGLICGQEVEQYAKECRKCRSNPCVCCKTTCDAKGKPSPRVPTYDRHDPASELKDFGLDDDVPF